MNKNSILIVDTQLNGHHILWLYLVGSVFLDNGFHVVLLVNSNQDAVLKRLDLLDVGFKEKVKIVYSSFDNKIILRKYWKEVVSIFNSFNCKEILFNNFDTIASKVFRYATFGVMPPLVLRGKISIIYHRPRPLDNSQSRYSTFWKKCGYNKLIRANYFKLIWLLDQHIVHNIHNDQVLFLPDPVKLSEVKAQLPEISCKNNDNIYLLQYGTGSARKGSYLLLTALEQTSNKNIHVWLVGVQEDRDTIELANKLQQMGVLTLVNRYVSEEEESWLFHNCDWVTIPYISHYGSSNILSKASKAAKPVIASDFGLIGKNVKHNNLGLLFKDSSRDDFVSLLNNLSYEYELFLLSNFKLFAEEYSYNRFKLSLSKLCHYS